MPRDERRGDDPNLQVLMDEGLVPDRPCDAQVRFIQEEFIWDLLWADWSDPDPQEYIVLKRFIFSPRQFKRTIMGPKGFVERVGQIAHAFPEELPKEPYVRDYSKMKKLTNGLLIPEYASGCVIGHTMEEVVFDVMFAHMLNKELVFENRFAASLPAFARITKACVDQIEAYENYYGKLEMDTAPRILRPDATLQVPQ